MHRYFIQTPWLVQKIFPRYLWRVPTAAQEVFLTFDDGPHPTITPWVLQQLRQYGARATFFCIGNNVRQYPEIYRQIMEEGHAVGNHTYSHHNGWKTDKDAYLEDIRKASRLINSSLFRPPYGRIKKNQAKGVAAALQCSAATIVMWDVLSADFDQNYTAEQCIQHVVGNYRPGSVIVFHDSEKAWKNLSVALPASLKHLQQNGYICKSLQGLAP